MLISVQGKRPELGSENFVSVSAQIIGDVHSGSECSFWYQVVVRGDVSPIKIGNQVNIQDGAVIHGTYQRHSVHLHDGVSIGHNCTVHGCEIGEGTLVGMGATVMDGVKVGARCLIGAGSLLPPGKVYPENSLIVGSPAKVIRTLTHEEHELLAKTTEHYLMYKNWHENCEVIDDE